MATLCSAAVSAVVSAAAPPPFAGIASAAHPGAAVGLFPRARGLPAGGVDNYPSRFGFLGAPQKN
jgi:hypothetical protein